MVFTAISLLASRNDSAKAQGANETVAKPAANLCVYADRIYSKGAIICFGSRLAMTCGEDLKWTATVPGGSTAADLVVICRDSPFPNISK